MIGRQRTDEEILRDVRDTLAWDSRIDDTNIKVEVENGAVRLSGHVGLYAEKLIAAEDAWRIKGVREVINELGVSPQPARSDAEITEDIMRAFRWDDRVDERNITVHVAGGAVRLTGTVRSATEKRAAEQDVWHVRGVVELEDELKVSPLRPRNDADIAADVRAALARDARISDAREIAVSCENRVVRLRGRVETSEERRAAEDDAWFTAGVVNVINELVIVRK